MRTRAEYEAWDPLFAELSAHPESPLARMLDTPWRLALAATVRRAGVDPVELIRTAREDAAAQRFPALLLGRFTASATSLFPRATRRGQRPPVPPS